MNRYNSISVLYLMKHFKSGPQKATAKNKSFQHSNQRNKSVLDSHLASNTHVKQSKKNSTEFFLQDVKKNQFISKHFTSAPIPTNPSALLENDRHINNQINDNVVSFMDDDTTASQLKNTTCLFDTVLFDDFLKSLHIMNTTSQHVITMNPYLLEQLKMEGFSTPTRIQTEAIPHILSGKDIMMRNETGSGKTLAFLLPAIQILLNLDVDITPRQSPCDNKSLYLDRENGTRMLILAPTRELINQTIHLAIRLTIPFPRIVVGCVTGGEKRKSEKARLRKGVILLGSTIGRICDHLDTTASFNIQHLNILILDEADRLLDMGFEKKIRWIVQKLKGLKQDVSYLNTLKTYEVDQNGNDIIPHISPVQKKKIQSSSLPFFQSIFVSATLTQSIEQLADFILRKEDNIWIGKQLDQQNKHENVISTLTESHILRGKLDATQTTTNLQIPRHIKQSYVEISLKTRLVTLISFLLDKTRVGKVAVFMSNCHSVEFYHAFCQVACWPNNHIFKSRISRHAEQMGEQHSKIKLSGPRPTPEQLQQFLGHKVAAAEIDNFESNNYDDSDKGLDDKQKSLKKKLEIEHLLGPCLFKDIKFFKLHGTLTQSDRLGYLNDFNQCTSKAVLFTTDVASRGLNLEGVKWVVQYDAPQEIEEYVHRIGRTGRIGQEGNALLFLSEHERGYLDYLSKFSIHLNPLSDIQILQPLIQEFSPDYIQQKRLKNLATYLSSFLCRQVEAELDLLHFARKAFSASYRAYRCYGKEIKTYFNIKSLHLGHLASSFGLVESPSTIGEKCRQGIMAAAQREMIADRKEKKSELSSKNSSERKNKRGRNSIFSSVGEGLLHNHTKHEVPKAIGKLTAQKKINSRKFNNGHLEKNTDTHFEVVPQAGVPNNPTTKRQRFNSVDSNTNNSQVSKTSNPKVDHPIHAKHPRKIKASDGDFKTVRNKQRSSNMLPIVNNNLSINGDCAKFNPVEHALACVRQNRELLCSKKISHT